MKKPLILTLFFAVSTLLNAGCVGLLKFPNPTEWRVYSVLKDGDQFDRDQLANRYLVAKNLAPIKGWYENTVVSVLGQPQEVQVMERDISEDWYFSYYKAYKLWPRTEEGLFIVRFYHGKVIDVINVS